MKRFGVFLLILGLSSTASAAALTSSGLVNRLEVSPRATSSAARLTVSLRTEAGVQKVMCSDGRINYFRASVPASNTASVVLVHSLLTAALMSQHSVDVVSEWNGSYCEIRTVTYAE